MCDCIYWDSLVVGYILCPSLEQSGALSSLMIAGQVVKSCLASQLKSTAQSFIAEAQLSMLIKCRFNLQTGMGA